MTNKTLEECVETLQKVETLLHLILGAEQGLTASELVQLSNQELASLSRILHVMGMRGWIEKRHLFNRRAAWFISSNLVRAAYEWQAPVSPNQVQILNRLMTTQLCCDRDLIGKALHVFNVVLNGGQAGKKLSELSENPTYQITTANYARFKVSLILRSWEQLGWFSIVRTDEHERWLINSKLADMVHQYQNRCIGVFQSVNKPMGGAM